MGVMIFVHLIQIAICFMFIGWGLGRIVEIRREDRRREEQRKRQSTPESQEVWRQEMQRIVGEAFYDRELKK